MDDEQLRKKAFAWNEHTFHYSQHRRNIGPFSKYLNKPYLQERHHAYQIADYFLGKSKRGISNE